MSRARRIVAFVAAIGCAAHLTAAAAADTAPLTPKSAAQFDLMGTWVSVITEDWVYRMVRAPKGDIGSVPLNSAGKKAAEDWNPQADIAKGDSCKAYGAIGNMRMPGRIRISWADDRTLKLDFDSGTQTRLFHFSDVISPVGYSSSDPPYGFADSPAASGDPSWQGHSVAAWQKQIQIRGLFLAMAKPPGPHEGGSLVVVTSHLKPGYLQSNGLPYSDHARLTEYFTTFKLPNGQDWFVVTSVVEDPAYLAVPFVTSTHFRREPSDSRWAPAPCEAH